MIIPLILNKIECYKSFLSKPVYFWASENFEELMMEIINLIILNHWLS